MVETPRSWKDCWPNLRKKTMTGESFNTVQQVLYWNDCRNPLIRSPSRFSCSLFSRMFSILCWMVRSAAGAGWLLKNSWRNQVEAKTIIIPNWDQNQKYGGQDHYREVLTSQSPYWSAGDWLIFTGRPRTIAQFWHNLLVLTRLIKATIRSSLIKNNWRDISNKYINEIRFCYTHQNHYSIENTKQLVIINHSISIK